MLGLAMCTAAVGLFWLIRGLRKARTQGLEASLQGFTYLLSGDLDGAISMLTRVAATGNPEAYFALGALFRRKGELERAIQLHRNLLKAPALLPSQRVRALTELGRDFRQAKLWREAIETLRQAVESPAPSASPGSPSDARAAQDELRETYLEAGDLEAASRLPRPALPTTL